MKFYVQSVEREGGQTVITLTTDVPADDVSSVLFTPGDSMEFNRMGDRVNGSLFVERTPDPTGAKKRVINTAESILNSDRQ